ncbi:MAG: hypothetical protein JXA42_03595 [Anaerolineales bacterium]|nr:hypothetical protein [Anaerolineales bacterium]
MMDMVVDDELAGMPMNLHYPNIYQHLQTCENCRTAHDELSDLLMQKLSGQLLRVPEHRPPNTQRIRWNLQISSSPLDSWQCLSCSIPQAHLSAILAANPLPPLSRQGVTRGQPYRLLLADVVHSESTTIGVQIILQSHWSSPDQIALVVDLSSDSPLPTPLTATLNWDHVSQTVLADDTGRAFFTGLPGSLIKPPVADINLAITHLQALE